jgi:hypothetical protein
MVVNMDNTWDLSKNKLDETIPLAYEFHYAIKTLLDWIDDNDDEADLYDNKELSDAFIMLSKYIGRDCADLEEVLKEDVDDEEDDDSYLDYYLDNLDKVKPKGWLD